MEYIPGEIHESFQKIHFLEVNHDFVWTNCDKRYSEFIDSSDWDDHTKPIELNPDDILCIRFFKYSQTSYAYCYLEKIIRDDVEIEFFTETLISREFLEANSKITGVFTDITTVMERDKKINQIINQ